MATVRRGLLAWRQRRQLVQRNGIVFQYTERAETDTLTLTLPTLTMRSTPFARSYISVSKPIPSALDGVQRRSSWSKSQSLDEGRSSAVAVAAAAVLILACLELHPRAGSSAGGQGAGGLCTRLVATKSTQRRREKRELHYIGKTPLSQVCAVVLVVGTPYSSGSVAASCPAAVFRMSSFTSSSRSPLRRASSSRLLICGTRLIVIVRINQGSASERHPPAEGARASSLVVIEA